METNTVTREQASGVRVMSRECPYIPDGANDVERVLITGFWRSAYDTYAQIGREGAYAADMLAAGEDVRIQDRGGIAANAARAAADEAAMNAVIEATRRRLGHVKNGWTGEWTVPGEGPAT